MQTDSADPTIVLLHNLCEPFLGFPLDRLSDSRLNPITKAITCTGKSQWSCGYSQNIRRDITLHILMIQGRAIVGGSSETPCHQPETSCTPEARQPSSSLLVHVNLTELEWTVR